jgi:hypothetical protein
MTGNTTARGERRRLSVDRVASLAGVASVLALVAGGSAADMGGNGLSPTMSPELLADGLRDRAGELEASASLLALSSVLFLLFLGPVWTRLRPASTALAVIGVSAGAVVAAQGLTFARESIALATAATMGDGVTAQVLLTSGWDTARLIAAPYLPLVAVTALAGFTSGALPRWFTWFSAAMVVLVCLSFSPVGPAGVLGLTGTVWVVVASLYFAAARPVAAPAVSR